MTIHAYGIRKSALSFLASLWLGSIAGTAAAGIFSQDFNNIEYLCCDWGPALTLPTKTNEVAQFNDAEDEVYFLKQINSFTRKKRLVKDVFNGRDYEDVGKGLSIWLCKMKADGSAKTEIKELWKNPAYPIQTDTQSTWMDVNRKTRTIALSITYAGSDLTGLWTVKLDGTDLKRIITPTLIEGHTQSVDSPSWTPDGQWIVFGESLRGGKRNRIAKCDRNGQQLVYLTDGTSWAMQPSISPDGTKIAYVVISTTKGGLWIMNVDGSNAQRLPNPDDKRKGRHGGTYPAWSPDGKRILYTGGASFPLVDATSGKITHDCNLPGDTTWGWPHWGRQGVIGFAVRGVIFTNIEINEAKVIGCPSWREGLGSQW